jgi:hypothetical protein
MIIKVVGVLLVVLLMLLALRTSRARTMRRRGSDAVTPPYAVDQSNQGGTHGFTGHH